MSKRTPAHKKGKAKGGTANLSLPELERAAFESLRQGQFKEAAEAFKRLVKQEARPDWQAALADAYAGRGRTLAAKGMAGEAAIVLENTRRPDGSVREPVLFVSCLLEAGKTEKALHTCLGSLTAPDLDPADRTALTDLAAVLLLTRPGAKALAESPDRIPSDLAGTARAAQAALAAWQAEQPDQADAALRGIPLGSPFKAVRLVLKALLVAGRQDSTGGDGEADNKRALLQRIHDSDPFAPLRDTALAALERNSTDRLAHWRALASEQRAFLAETGSFDDAAVRALEALLSAEARGPEALLSHLLKQANSLPRADVRAAVIELLPDAPSRINEADRILGGVSALEQHWIEALAHERGHSWRRAEAQWRRLRDLLHSSDAPLAATDARALDALICRHLADVAERSAQGLDGNGTSDAVIHYLEEAIKADPDDADTVDRLIARLKAKGRTKDWHALAEAQIDRFPDDTRLLLHAVEAAAERRAYRKATSYAHRLLERDPINQSVRQRMIDLQRAHARKKVKDHRLDLAEETLAAARQWEPAGAPNPSLRIGQALLALAKDDDTAALAQLEEAVRRAPVPIVGWFQAALEAQLMGLDATKRKRIEKALAQAAKGPATPADIQTVLDALTHLPEVRAHRKTAAAPLQMVEKWMVRGAHRTIPVVEFHHIADAMRTLALYKTLGSFAEAAHHRNRLVPAYRFYQIVARLKDTPTAATPADLEELAYLSGMAKTSGDVQTSSRIERFGFRAVGRNQGLLDEPDMGQDVFDALREMVEDIRDHVPMLLENLGRRGAIKAVVDILKRSPLGDGLSMDILRTLATALVDNPFADTPLPAPDPDPSRHPSETVP